MTNRPARTRIINELGNDQTLPEDKGQFEVIPGGPDTVVLGLGPQPELLTEYFPDYSKARFIESPEMAGQIERWTSRIPVGLTRMEPEQFSPRMARSNTIIRYRPGLKAFPAFWGPLTARTAVSRLSIPQQQKTIWLPLGEDDLLGRELSLAFGAKGYTVRFVDREKLERSPGTELPKLLEEEIPELFFSINFKGLEPFGLGYNMLREAGTRVAIWLVDNPFNVLTSVKSTYWRDAKLFVTDHTFIGPLITAGAKWVNHLPLAASPELFAEGGTLPEHGHDLEDKLVFVGRSEFPKRDAFFAGLTPDHALLNKAITMLERGERAHFHWWQDYIQAELWPGNAIRQVGVGAEVAGYAWKVRCLEAAHDEVTIFGDDKWGKLDEVTAEVRPLLDYYTHLPAVYRAAAVSLNVTGMQLPAGLTQRHFDVWCAGGFLISDDNPGLSIFPDELVSKTTFSTPNEILPLFTRFQAESTEKDSLRAAWRDLIINKHTYHNRVVTILKTLGMSWTWTIP